MRTRSEQKWPYNLPIWRGAHEAESPNGHHVAVIDPAYEVSMGSPTSGILRLNAGLTLEHCNPSFVWSDDSRYLAVPQFYNWLGLFRRQRLILIDFHERALHASKERASYYQPESFVQGRLAVTREPAMAAEELAWDIPGELERFTSVAATWSPVAERKVFR